MQAVDWFHKLTGFRELEYESTRSRLSLKDGRLLSLENEQSYGIGKLELVSVAELRSRALSMADAVAGRLSVSNVSGDVREMHRDPENQGALFQVASQFNLLEMVSSRVTPEHGVTRYACDGTQGPACAIAGGAATIYRNYFVPVNGVPGQTATRQLDGLKDLGNAFGNEGSRLWTMSNGYALCTNRGLAEIARRVEGASAAQVDTWRDLLRIGVHWDVEVTDRTEAPRPTVSQAFCSALPVTNGNASKEHWRVFATLVLEGLYEATLWAAVINAARGASSKVLLTRVGGSAFGNDHAWIDVAMRRALLLVKDRSLDVRLVSHGPAGQELLALAAEFV